MNPELLDRMITRTVEHIHRVQNNMVLLTTKFRRSLDLSVEDCRQLMFNVMKHDQSKFSEAQFLAYIELTEYYHQRKVLGNWDYRYTSETQEKVNQAIADHYKSENHHPEIFMGTIGKWSKFEAIETVCDLQAMAQEFDEGTCRNYYEQTWKKKQSQFFYDDLNWVQVTYWMHQAIECFEGK